MMLIEIVQALYPEGSGYVKKACGLLYTIRVFWSLDTWLSSDVYIVHTIIQTCFF